MVLVGEKNITEMTLFSIKEAKDFFKNLKLEPDKCVIAEPILKEVNRRLDFALMWDWNISPLTVAVPHFRWEAERIRLATQVGSGLVGWFMCWMTVDWLTSAR